MRIDSSAARAVSSPATTPSQSSNPTAAPVRAAAVPEPGGKSNKSYDGMFLGAGGQAFSSSSNSLSDIPAVRPQNGESRGLTVLVNGIGTSPSGATNQMQQLANTSGNSVVGIYNARSEE